MLKILLGLASVAYAATLVYPLLNQAVSTFDRLSSLLTI
jgi:hypothetical protein